jgi:hypothetical protein
MDEIAAITGNASLNEIQRCTRAADQKAPRVFRGGKRQIANIHCQNFSVVQLFGQKKIAKSKGDLKGGGPERSRTSDLRFRKPLLYPAELRDHAIVF